MNTKATDKTSDITPPQQKVLDFIKMAKGSAESIELQARGYDIRAANNLVRKNVLTLTNGVYRLRQKVGETSEKPAKVAANTAAPAKPPAAERTAAMFADPAGEPAKEIEAPESVERPATKGEGTDEPTKRPAKGKAAPAKVVEPRACLCGCGFMSKARFLPGHDAKLHSLVLRIHRKKAERSELTTAEPTLEYLKTAPWMTDEIRAAVGL